VRSRSLSSLPLPPAPCCAAHHKHSTLCAQLPAHLEGHTTPNAAHSMALLRLPTPPCSYCLCSLDFPPLVILI
jgi:hypothetical protein